MIAWLRAWVRRLTYQPAQRGDRWIWWTGSTYCVGDGVLVRCRCWWMMRPGSLKLHRIDLSPRPSWREIWPSDN